MRESCPFAVHEAEVDGERFSRNRGLFEPENNKVSQSMNAVKLGIEVIKDLESLDAKEFKSFSVKIAVVVGGPIYCTVINSGNQRMFTISG